MITRVSESASERGLLVWLDPLPVLRRDRGGAVAPRAAQRDRGAGGVRRARATRGGLGRARADRGARDLGCLPCGAWSCGGGGHATPGLVEERLAAYR